MRAGKEQLKQRWTEADRDGERQTEMEREEEGAERKERESIYIKNCAQRPLPCLLRPPCSSMGQTTCWCNRHEPAAISFAEEKQPFSPAIEIRFLLLLPLQPAWTIPTHRPLFSRLSRPKSELARKLFCRYRCLLGGSHMHTSGTNLAWSLECRRARANGLRAAAGKDELLYVGQGM